MSTTVITATESLELFEALKGCSNENDVKKILDNHPFTSNKKNWNPLGDNPDNAAMTQNTGGSLGSCMAELITNAIDALITRKKKEFEENGVIFPEDALKSPEKILKFMNPDIFENKKELHDFARDLMGVVTTEYNVDTQLKIRTRNITVFDKGCGQNAQNFKKTFCSIGAGKSNKANLPWLHGSYGQGSTAANGFSGEEGYKLIASRQRKEHKWAWTIIRRSPLDPSMLEYLIINDEHSVLEFDTECIKLGYYCHGNKIADNVATIEFGSMIKIYSVDIKKGFTEMKKTVGTAMLRPVLPIRSFEFSYSREDEGSKDLYDARWIDGLGNYIDTLVEEGKAQTRQFEITVPKFKNKVYGVAYFIESPEVLDKFKDWLSYSHKNTRIFHSNNGQVQHIDNISVIGKHYPPLKEHVIIELDLSYIDQVEAKARLFKSDRLSFQVEKPLYKQYAVAIDEMIESSEFLKDWNIILGENKVKHAYSGHTDDKVKSSLNFIQKALLSKDKEKAYDMIFLQESQKSLSDKVTGKVVEYGKKLKNNSEIVEVKGKVQATVFKKIEGDLVINKKSQKNNVSVKFKTDAATGSVVGKDATNRIKVKKINLHKKDGDVKFCDEDKVLLSVTEGKNNLVICDIGFNSELQKSFEDGDKVFVELEMETIDKNTGFSTFIKEEVSIKVVYKEIEITGKGKKNKQMTSSDDLFDIAFATLDRKVINGKSTGELPFNFDKRLGWNVFYNKDKFTIQVNLDNPELQHYLSNKKYVDDVQLVIESLYDLIGINVVSLYKLWLKDHLNDKIEAFCDEANEENYGLKTISAIMSQIHIELGKAKAEKKKEVS